jgi:amidase
MTGNPFVVALYEEAIRILKAQGAEVVEVELLRLIAPNGVGDSNVLQYEFKDGLNSYLAKSNAKVRSLEDVIRFNSEHADKVMPWFRQETLEVSQKKGGLDSREYLDALKLTKGAGKVIDDLMREQRLDAISGVSAGIPGCTDPLNGDYGTGFYFSRPAAIAGYPHITVPMGYAGELPAGLSFIGSAWQEGPLLSMAYAFEQASRKRRAPRFIPYI